MKISPPKVMQSAAGFYVGTSYSDPEETGGHDFPYSRDSGYFQTQKEAEAFLQFFVVED